MLGFDSLVSIAFICGQTGAGERADAVQDAPMLPAAKGYCTQGRASQKDGVVTPKPLQCNTQSPAPTDSGTDILVFEF